MKSGAQKGNEKAKQQLYISVAKSRKLTESCAAPITPTNRPAYKQLHHKS